MHIVVVCFSMHGHLSLGFPTIAFSRLANKYCGSCRLQNIIASRNLRIHLSFLISFCVFLFVKILMSTHKKIVLDYDRIFYNHHRSKIKKELNFHTPLFARVIFAIFRLELEICMVYVLYFIIDKQKKAKVFTVFVPTQKNLLFISKNGDVPL